MLRRVAAAYHASLGARACATLAGVRRRPVPEARRSRAEDADGSTSLLHIAIDAHAVGTGLAGNETYIRNLVEALADLDARNRYTLYVTRRGAADSLAGRW